MLFTTFEFLVLLVVTFSVYYLRILSKAQPYILLTSSLLFYGWNKPWLVALLLISIILNSVCTILVARADKRFKKKLIALLGVAINVGFLAFLKYNKLIILTLFDSVSNLSPIEKMIYYLPLPIGISFFTFQGISLVMDVYRDKTIDNDWIKKHPLKFLFDTGFFLSFFPQLIAGPIVKAKDFFPQIESKSLKALNWQLIFNDLILGYFLKMVIADNLKEHTQYISFPQFYGLSSTDLVLMIYGYTIQIFADFAGYSLIALGLARIFGYQLRDNFMFPFISVSFQEFWKRWHISLSSWLKEYLYISLGGNRKGKFRTYLNLILTMLIGGIWHGASWSFAIWGLFHGLLLTIEHFFKDKIKTPDYFYMKAVRVIWVFTAVSVAFVLYKMPEFHHSIKYFEAIFTSVSYSLNQYYRQFNVILYSIPIVFYHLIYLRKDRLHLAHLQQIRIWSYGIMIFLLFTNAGTSGSFIYFRF
jgi:alginate O-acetyltransferase complex protein AlgI